MLQSLVETLDGVDEKYHELYKETDDGFELQSDAKAKVKEFRTNNTKLLKELSKLDKKFEEYIESSKKTDNDPTVDNSTKTSNGDDNATEQRWQKRLEDLEAKYEKAQSALERTTIRDALRDAAIDAGVRKNAVSAFVNAHMGEWVRGDNGELVRQVDGDVVYSDENPSKPQTMDEFFTEKAASEDFYFEPSTGGGAPGSDPATGRSKVKVLPNDPAIIGKHAKELAEGTATIALDFVNP
jgi:hypothetical protein